MRSYYPADPQLRNPQILQITHQDHTFQLSLRYVAMNRRYEWANRRRPKTHAHDLYHLVLYTGPANTIVADGRLVSVQPNTLVVVSPGNRHDLQGVYPGVVEYSELTFALESDDGTRLAVGFEHLIARFFGCKTPAITPVVLLPEFQSGRLKRRLEQLIEVLESADGTDMSSATVGVLEFLHAVSESVAPPGEGGKGGDGKTHAGSMVRQARRYLDMHYCEKLTIDEVAQHVSVSREHLIRLFSAQYGISPMRYVRRRRLDTAATLLSDTSLPISTVAEETGFGDVQQFSRTFKKATGRSPGQYRQASRR